MGTHPRLDLYLIRHVITKWNQEKRYLGHSDEPIVKEQLEDLVTLKKELIDISFDEIFTSDLSRCRETLAFLLPREPYEVDERLREFHFGEWEGKTYEDLKGIKEYRQWIDDWQGNRVPGGESGKDFTERVENWKNYFLNNAPSGENKTALVMSHGGVIRYLLSTLDGSKAFWNWHVNHGEGIHITFLYREGSWKCSSLSVVPTQVKEKL